MTKRKTLFTYRDAVYDFYEARQKATVREVMSWLKGESDRLLSFDDVRQKLKVVNTGMKELRDIPLDAIVGSVNRYDDFTREFLPRSAVSVSRWASVEREAMNLEGLPPIEVYQIGDVYFVSDGNHRVSVARKLGNPTIQAYVIKINARVPLKPEDRPEALILKSELVDFLEHTRLDQLRPDSDLTVTIPGAYSKLEEHISVHRYYMGLEQKHEISDEDAVSHWYDCVYLPVVEIIRLRGLVRDFPGKTETDLYLWLADHRADLEHKLGMEIPPETAASSLASQFSSRFERVRDRMTRRLHRWLLPEAFETGSPVGKWRQEKEAYRREDCLFSDLLVPMNGREEGWFALEQALVVARMEGSRLHGLHVVTPRTRREKEAALAVQAEFAQRCKQAGVEGKLVLSTGDVTKNIVDRSFWTDLVVVNLAYPPPRRPLAKLSSGFHTLVQRSSHPILAVPQVISPLRSALLAYDGSLKANEALYVATYLAGEWVIPLVVVTILDKDRVTEDTARQAQAYLEDHAIQAVYVQTAGEPAPTLLRTAEEYHSDLILMGGYGNPVMLNYLLESVVDKVLRQSCKPVLLCR